MKHYELTDVFKFLPSQKIKAKELKRGDVAFVHARWCLILGTEVRDIKSNNGWNVALDIAHGGTGFLPEDHEVNVIHRDLFESAELMQYLKDLEEESRKMEELARIEEEEEREREKEYLRERLRHLGDD